MARALERTAPRPLGLPSMAVHSTNRSGIVFCELSIADRRAPLPKRTSSWRTIELAKCRVVLHSPPARYDGRRRVSSPVPARAMSTGGTFESIRDPSRLRGSAPRYSPRRSSIKEFVDDPAGPARHRLSAFPPLSQLLSSPERSDRTIDPSLRLIAPNGFALESPIHARIRPRLRGAVWPL